MLRRRAYAFPILVVCSVLELAGCVGEPEDTPSVTSRAAGALAAREYFVDPVTGSDTNPGTAAAPFRTVQKSIAVVQAGDTVRLRANAYYPYTDFRGLTGRGDAPITFREWDAGTRPTFDRGLPLLRDTPAGQWVKACANPGSTTCAPDEWRTVAYFPTDGDNQLRGQIVATRQRLITYGRLEDLRAKNESFHLIKLSDPRPGPGPDKDLPSRKHPWTYFGPGLFLVKDPAGNRGHIHVRLSPTHLEGPGVQNYAGPADPNQMSLSITYKDWQDDLRTFAVELNGSSHVVFKNLAFQNGGNWTVGINDSDEIAFDHCEIRPGTHGVYVAHGSEGVGFHHTLFDGGVPPWMTRSETKDGYWFRRPDGTAVELAPGAKATADTLVRHDGFDGEYDHCTFRHAHDAIMVRAHDVEIHDSLFEDVFDEAIQILSERDSHGVPWTSSNVRIYRNLIRQTLTLFRFLDGAPGGPVYVYRNVFDQRIPTRGYRVLTATDDAPAPVLWRWGFDVKLTGDDVPVPPLYVYQNTFIGSNSLDKVSWQARFLHPGPAPFSDRWFFNNINVGLDLAPEIYYAKAYQPGAFQSRGNLWYRSPLGDPRFELGTTPLRPADLPAGWEQGSRFYDDPALANFTDEAFDYGQAYPNTDYRPTLLRAGVALPAQLPDPVGPGPQGAEMGAQRLGDGPLVVGRDDEPVVFPEPGVPVARAGDDVALADAGGDGFEQVTVDGGRSSDPNGRIVAYRWRLGGDEVATGARVKLDLPEGSHNLQLEVTDDQGKTDTDAVRIRIGAAAPADNLLACPGFEDTRCSWKLGDGASLEPGVAHSGRRALRITDGVAANRAVQRLAVTGGARYRVSTWTRADRLFGRVHVDARFLDAAGGDLGTVTAVEASRDDVAYTYRAGDVRAPAGAVAMELIAQVEAVTGHGWAAFDDLRVRDGNAIANGGFETRNPTGQDWLSPPGWELVASGGAHAVLAVDEPGQSRSGRYGVVLSGSATSSTATARVPRSGPLTAGAPYRFTMWLRTTPELVDTTQLWVALQFMDADDHLVRQESFFTGISPAGYTLVAKTLTPPAGTVTVKLFVQLKNAPAGAAAYIDDLLLQPYPP